MVFVFGVLLVVLFTVGGGSGTPVVHSRCRACCVAVLVVVPCSSYEPSLGCSSLRSIRVFSQHSWGLEAAAWIPPKKILPAPLSPPSGRPRGQEGRQREAGDDELAPALTRSVQSVDCLPRWLDRGECHLAPCPAPHGAACTRRRGREGEGEE